MSPPTATVLSLILIASAASAAARNTLCSVGYLQAGDYLQADDYSESSPYKFIMQNNNLGVYAGSIMLSSWSFKPGYHVYCLVLQSDGNLVILGYGPSKAALWSTNTTLG